MTITQQGLYDLAVIELGERMLASMSEDRKTLRVLDKIWNSIDVVKYCLEEGPWTHAMRAVRMDYDADIEPEFGHLHGFRQPDDYVRMDSISLNERFDVPLRLNYTHERQIFYMDSEYFYLRYVSDDADYGRNMALWTPSFTEYVSLYLAYKALPTIVKDRRERREVRDELKIAMKEAKGRNNVSRPVSRRPMSNWGNARLGHSHRRYDREDR